MPEEGQGKPSKSPGPTPDRLKIEGDWQDALREALGTKSPETDEDTGESADENGDEVMPDDE